MRIAAIDLQAWLKQARTVLKNTSDQPSVEAQALLAFVLGKPRAWLLAHLEYPLGGQQTQRLDSLLDLLATGTPLPQLTGVQEFFGLEFAVTPDVLIPRPETELLVEYALNWMKNNSGAKTVADVGTGTGCIAVCLAKNALDVRVTAIDLSWKALLVAKQNLHCIGVDQEVDLVLSNLFNGISGQFDLLCANLPYIPSSELSTLAVARHEPRLALDGGPDGLDLIRELLRQAPSRLKPGGLALLEIEVGQGNAVLDMAARAFPGGKTGVIQDLSGRDRLLRIEAKR